MITFKLLTLLGSYSPKDKIREVKRSMLARTLGQATKGATINGVVSESSLVRVTALHPDYGGGHTIYTCDENSTNLYTETF